MTKKSFKKIAKEETTPLALCVKIMTLMDENRNLSKAVRDVTENMHGIIRGTNEANMELAKKMQALEVKVSELEKFVIRDKKDEDDSNFSDNPDHDA